MIYAIGSFLIVAFNLTLWFLTFFGRKLGELAIAYFWWSFFIAAWALGYGITLGGFFDYGTTLAWNKYCQAMAMLIAPFFFKYCCELVDEYENKKKIFLVYLLFAILNSIGIAFTPYYVSGLWSFGVFKYQPLGGPLYFIYVAFFHWCTLHGFLLVLSRYREFSELRRKQLKLFLIATGLSYFGGSTLFIAPFRIALPSFGVFLILAYVVATGWAIHKYQFLDFPSLLKSNEAVAYHNDKLMLLGLLSSALNHEIKNPLFMIRELTRKVLQNEAVVKNHDASGAIEKIDTQIGRMSKLVERLADFAKPSSESSQKEEINLRQVIDSALFFASSELKYQNIKVEINIPDDLPKLQGDRSQFEVIFLNLIINAYHAMPEGGRLTIEGRLVPFVTLSRAKGLRTLSARSFAGAQDDNFVEIVIADTGTGIPKDQLKDIFKPFYTTKQKSGTGLGLYIVKTLVEQNKGKIEVESELNKGTRFILNFNL